MLLNGAFSVGTDDETHVDNDIYLLVAGAALNLRVLRLDICIDVCRVLVCIALNIGTSRANHSIRSR